MNLKLVDILPVYFQAGTPNPKHYNRKPYTRKATLKESVKLHNLEETLPKP